MEFNFRTRWKNEKLSTWAHEKMLDNLKYSSNDGSGKQFRSTAR